jgi:hypothetical protein
LSFSSCGKEYGHKSLKNSLGLEIGPVQASAKVEMKMFVFTFSRKFIFAFRKNLLTKIDENDKDFREIENAKTETPFHVSKPLQQTQCYHQA